MNMKMVSGPHWRGLEEALFGDLQAIQAQNPALPVAVLAPAASLLDYLRRQAARRFPALLGVHFFHYHALKFEILRLACGKRSGRTLVRLPDAALQLLAEAEVRRGPRGTLQQYLEAVPAATGALMASFRDLRDSGLGPDLLDTSLSSGLSSDDREVLSLYRTYCQRLDQLQAEGYADDAGLALLCCEQLPGLRLPFAHLLHYGAYELTGAHRRLLDALSKCLEVRVYVPCHETAPVYDYARRASARSFAAAGAAQILEDSDVAPGEAAGAAIFDPRPGAAVLPAGFVRVGHAQGVDAEVHFAARQILALYRNGVALEDVGVTARSLDAYTSAVARVFASQRIPMTCSAGLPLLRWPAARAFADLVAVLAGGFERLTVLDLLRYPGFRFSPFLRKGQHPRVDAWDRWTRRAGIVAGHASWRPKLEAELQALLQRLAHDEESQSELEGDGVKREDYSVYRQDQTELLLAVLDALKEQGDQWRSCSGWAEHEQFLRRTAARFLSDFCEDGEEASPELGPIRALFEAMRVMGRMQAHLPSPDRARVADWVAQQLAVGKVPLRGTGGVRVLDFMQARGHRFRYLFVLGMNAGLFPRRLRPDPLLSEAGRRHIAAATGAPLAAKMESAGEESLLLALLLASAGEGITFSYQRADDQGEMLLPSLAFREVARLVSGRRDAASYLAEQAAHVPAHPGDVAGFYAAHTGLASPGDVLVAAGVDGGWEQMQHAARASGLNSAALEAGIGALRVVEDPHTDNLAYDGRIDVSATQLPVLSTSSLETLGKCPLQYFFKHLLRIRKLEEPLLAHDPSPMEFGHCAHALLRIIYQRLLEGDLLRPEALKAGWSLKEALAQLETHWDDVWAGPRSRIGDSYPLLWRSLTERWQASLRSFLEEDLTRLSVSGYRLYDFEVEHEAPVSLRYRGRDSVLPLRGRFDRVLGTGNGSLVVEDYKTGGYLAEKVNPKEMLRGNQLQIPAYVLLAEQRYGRPAARVSGVLLGIGPRHEDAEDEKRRQVLELDKDARLREGILETLDVLRLFREAGLFPFHRDEKAHCGFCDYRSACRLRHGPSLQRVQGASAYFGYFQLKEKVVRKPLLPRGGKE